MKTSAENFLGSLDKINPENLAFLVFGNDASLITKIEKEIFNSLKKRGVNETINVDLKKNNRADLNGFTGAQSLFNNSKIICVSSPSDKTIDIINNTNIDGNTIIINGEGVRASSKIKKYFDTHKFFYSISCYKITKEFKKRIIDKFISESGCKFSKDAYWFVLENSSDEYQVLENELTKFLTYSDKEITLKEIRTLSAFTKKIDFDEIFFNSVVGKHELVVNSLGRGIVSLSDAYGFLQVIKSYSKILIKTSENKDAGTNIGLLVDQHLPKYLFKQKNNFEAIIERSSINKIK